MALTVVRVPNMLNRCVCVCVGAGGWHRRPHGDFVDPLGLAGVYQTKGSRKSRILFTNWGLHTTHCAGRGGGGGWLRVRWSGVIRATTPNQPVACSSLLRAGQPVRLSFSVAAGRGASRSVWRGRMEWTER